MHKFCSSIFSFKIRFVNLSGLHIHCHLKVVHVIALNFIVFKKQAHVNLYSSMHSDEKHRSSFEIKGGSDWYKSVNETDKPRLCFWWKCNSQESNIAKLLKFIDKESQLKLVGGFFLTQIGFWNALLSELPKKDLHGLQMNLQIVAVRIIENKPRYSTDRITSKAIELHFWPVKARK